MAVDLSPIVELTDERFSQLCAANRDLRLERTAAGELVVVPPTGGQSSRRNARITSQLLVWADKDRTGVVFDSNGGFKLPNGAIRAPDASWVRLAAWQKLTDEEKEKFLPLCPDFVIELRSLTDSISDVQNKMEEYLDNGAQLGWLIDPQERVVYIYRQQAQTETLDNPQTLAGDPVLAGFVLDLQEIW
ncbi:MAG: Uma2 family endonuclease [Pyrinomonadaceae bacterium]|nr:Uma2 family endonuclease [Pyrinomonadaceae bacterium]